MRGANRRGADGNHPHAPADDHRTKRSRRGAKGEADSQFSAASDDRGGEDSVQADDQQRERDRGEAGSEPREKAFLTQRQACFFVERPHTIDEECGIELAHLPRDLLTGEVLPRTRAQNDSHINRLERAGGGDVPRVRCCNLCQREEDRIRRGPMQILAA
jgi:hypothetical protein